MKKQLLIALSASAAAGMALNANAAQLAFYGDGTDADAAAELNLAAPVAGATVSDLDSFGVLAGSNGDPTGGDVGRITRPSFATDTPNGPTAGSTGPSEWFESRSVENQGPTSSTDNYFFFTVDADAGFSLDLDSLAFDFWVSDGAGAAVSADAEVFVSVDGGAFNSFGSVTATDTLGVGTAAPVTTANIDLSSITGADSVEVRVSIGYTQGNSNGISGFTQGYTLEGTVVPEPGSLALLGLGGLALLRRRRPITH